MTAAAQSLVEQIQRIQQQISDGNTSRMGFLTTVRDKLSNIKTKVQDKIAQLQQTDADSGQVRAELAAKTADITVLQGEAESLRKEKVGLEKQLQLKEEEFAALQSGNSQKLAELQQREQLLTAEIQQKENAIKEEQVKKELSSAANAAALQAQKLQLETERNNAIQETEQARKDIVAVQTQLGQLRNELDNVQQELNAVKQQRDTAVQEKNTLIAELDALRRERSTLQEQLAAIAQALQDAAANQGPMQNEILQLLQDIDTALGNSAAQPATPSTGEPQGSQVTTESQGTAGTGEPVRTPGTAEQQNLVKTTKQGTVDQQQKFFNGMMGNNVPYEVKVKNQEGTVTGENRTIRSLDDVVSFLNQKNAGSGDRFKDELLARWSAVTPQSALKQDKNKDGMPDYVDIARGILATGDYYVNPSPATKSSKGGRRRTRKARRHRKRRTARKQRGGFMYSKTSRRPSLSSRRSRRSASRRRTPF